MPRQAMTSGTLEHAAGSQTAELSSRGLSFSYFILAKFSWSSRKALS